MEIKIYSQDGTLKLTASPGSGGQCVKQLQGDSELSLSFDYFSYVALDVNDYVDFCGDRYWLLEQYRPKEVSTIQWRYDVKLYGIESLIKRYLVIEHTDGDANPVFTLTAPASQHMRMIVECLNNATGTTDWQLGTVLTTGNITIDYTGKYCDEGLRELAEAANTEYWFSGDNGKTLNLCRCERGETIELKYGVGLISLERDVADNAKFYTRLYPVGSSRNINPETYGHTRLQLPNNQKYVDLDIARYGVIDHYEQDAFAGIYPRYTGTVSTVRVEDRTDEDGTEFKVYFIKDASLPFNPNNFLLPNEKIRISFQTGDLQGLGETDDHYFEADYNSTTGEFEIINIWTDGEQLPRPGLEPETGNTYIPWNISMPQTYITLAEQELAAAVDSYNQAHFVDNSVYRGTTNHVWIEADQTRNIYIGRLVKLVSDQYFPSTGYRNSRIVKITRRLDLPSQMELEISDAVSTGTLTKINDDIRGLWEFAKGLETDDSDKWLSKRHNDTAQGLIRFIRGLQVGERFVTGLLGEGGIFRKEADGTTYIEADKLYIRMKAYFDSVEIRDYRHSAGNRIASEAGAMCCRVDWIDASGNSLKQTSENLASTVLFRCYFRGSDGEDEVRNNFIVGDLAYCHITTVETEDDSPIAKGLNMTHYWRLIVGRNAHGTLTDDGEHWIDLSNRVSETVTISGTSYTRKGYQPGSDVPAAQNDIIQLGNIRDTDRQGAIIEFVTGADAPSYQIFQGIGSDVSNPYSLEGKNYVRFGYDSESGGAQAYIGNPDGSTYLWYHLVTEEGVTFPRLDIKANVRFTSPTTHQDTTIEDFASAVTGSIGDLQSQIDGEVDTWFYAGTPTLNNAPANEWTTNAEKERHLGDLYYDIGTGDTGGFAYRFIKTESGGTTTYSWQYIDDTAITEALAKASQAYDLADHKRRVFILPVTIGGVTYNNPYPPYDNGDLWVNAVWPASGASKGSTYNDDFLRCKTSKNSTQQFSINDWVKASKYTDDSALNDFVTNTYAGDLAGIQTQVDGKAETFYQDTDPSTNWNAEDKPSHVGDIWYDTNANRGKKTYIWRDRGEGQSNRFYWAEQAVPSVVFDEIDGKAAIYVTWGAWIKEGVSNLNEKDLFIPADDTTQGGVTYKKDKVYRCINASTPEFEEIQYTDDSGLQNFINNTYNVKIVDLEKQIDGKAETWYQDTNPASASGWVAADHVGDLWYCTADIAGTDYKKGTTWFYKKTGTNTYAWVKQDVPEEVFDKIDGKSAIFTNTTSNPPTGYKKNDLWILPADATINGVSYKQGDVLVSSADSTKYTQAHWSRKLRYTDDTAFNNFFANTYQPFVTQIQSQVDGKAETWYQSTNPATAWDTPELKQAHKGDIWHNTSSSTVAGVDAGQDAIWSGTKWIMSDVPQEVYDLVDGKSAIWVTWNGWIDSQGNNNLMLNDLYIPSVDYPTSNPTYKQNKVYRCTTAGNSPVFTEINYTDNAEFNNFVDTTYSADKDNLQNQIDGKYETWFYEGVPTLNNAPASSWTSVTLKKNHLGDLYWDKTNKHAYRFVVNNSTYSWQQIGDEGVIAAMAQAADAQDTADNKRRVFVNTPTTPYDVGDLWAQGSGGDIFKCKTARATGSYKASDWELASKYTDDSSLLTFLNGWEGSLGEAIKEQVDKKAETWVSSSNPATAWNTTALKDEHVGDMWLNTSNAAVAGVGSMKTAIYKKNGSSYSWVVDDSIPNSVFDTIDGKKTIYIYWDSTSARGGVTGAMRNGTLQVRDLFIPNSDISKGYIEGTSDSTIIYAKSKVYRCTGVGAYSDGAITTYPTFVEIAYTDDSSLNSFLNTVYGTTVLEQIKKQNDKKAETWYQNQDPSTRTPSQNPPGWKGDDDNLHIGDIWHNTSSTTINGVEAGRDAIWTGTGWEMSDVPQSVYDKIDGKADIFVTRPTTYNKYDMWIIEDGLASTYMPTGCKSGDIVVASGMTGTTTKRTNNYVKKDWQKKDRYTDDGKVNEIINKYGNVLGIDDPTAVAVGDAVGFLSSVLNHPYGSEPIGGLFLTSLIAMRGTESTPKVWGGMNGVYQTDEEGTSPYRYKGHGIAAWYGGAMVDYQSLTATQQSKGWDTYRWAKSLFRFDGSGYVAGGNLSWDKSGNVTIQGHSINATTLTSNGSAVATEGMLASYLPLSAGSSKKLTGTLYAQNVISKTNGTYNLGTSEYYWKYLYVKRIYLAEGVWLEYDSANTSVKLNGSLYATGGVSALGAGSGGSSGGGDVTWALLASSSDKRQIALSHLTNALSSYATQSWVLSQIAGSSTGGTVTAVKVGTTTYNPSSGVVSLPAYLPLTGGTLTGGILIKYDSDSSRVYGFSMKDTSNSVTASILYHNTEQNWIINSNGSSNIWTDAEGKYSLIVGNNKLTYNTHTIWHSGNDDGLFTAFVADGTSTKITIGGTTKSLTIPFATEANRLLAAQILPANTSGDANTMQLDGEGTKYSVLTNYHSNTKWQNMPTFGANSFGGVVEIKGEDSSLKMQFAWAALHGNTTAPTDGLWYRARADKGYLASDWHKVAFTDSDITGNAATATKLKNTRTLWGNNFSGTADVGGNIILDAGDGGRQVKIIKNGSFLVSASTGGMAGGLSAITNDGSTTLGMFGYYCSGDTLVRLFIGDSYSSPWVSFLSDGSVGIGTTSPTEKLHVSGNAKATKFIGALEGNADTATTLKTARTLWGQSFDGSANVSGDMSSVGNITFSATGKNIGGLIYFDTTNSRVGIKTSSPAYVLDVYGTSRSKYMVFYNNAYNGNAGYVGAGSSSSNEIILEAYSGNALSLWANGTRTVYINTSNNVGIGTDSPSQKLHVSGNIYATGAVTCLSDIRQKSIVRPTEITVEQIARMPSIVYRWKDNGDDHDEHVGSIAQDWQKTLPQVVLTAKDEKKTLSMQYGVAALVSAITIARKVVDHERRIKELENENRKLKEQLKIA